MGLMNLIGDEYGEAEAERFKTRFLSEADKRTVAEAGRDVLKLVRPERSALACAHMSALWAAFIRDNTDIPVHVVAGNLSAGGKRIFYNSRPIEEMRAAFATSDLQWDGHAWIAVPGKCIGDASLGRTARFFPEGHWLRALVSQTFGPNAGLFLGTPPDGWVYDPKFVLTDDQITGLVKGTVLQLDP